VALIFAALALSAQAQTAQRPNIVLLIVDDMGWGDMAAYGSPNLRTPQLDRMAAQGQRWTNFYMSSPVCSPSRAAMLTGRAETRSGLYGVRNGVVIENDPYTSVAHETTVATLLRGAGYATALFGKWHLGDSPPAYPTRHGFDRWWGTTMSNDAYFQGGITNDELRKMVAAGSTREQVMGVFLKQAGDAFRKPSSKLWNVPLVRSERREKGGDVTYIDETLERPIDQVSYNERLTDQVVAYIEQKHSRPFFAWVGYEKPHLPHFAGPRFAGKSRAGMFGDVIEELDHSVGLVLEAIRRSPQAKNTLVVFVSDNGPWLLFEEFGGSAGPLRDGKGSSYEGGVRVPALFWQPGTIAPAVVEGMGSGYDLLPTFAALAGAPLPSAQLDGLDLQAVLRRQAPSPRLSMPFFSNGQLMAWREGDWKLHFREVSGRNYVRRKLPTPALYHLGRDPGEKFDQADAEPAIVERLTQAALAFESSIAKAAPVFDRIGGAPPAR